jgi:hypothetical protein
MQLYNGKAKDYSFKALMYRVFWELARPIEQLEPTDFSKN